MHQKQNIETKGKKFNSVFVRFISASTLHWLPALTVHKGESAADDQLWWNDQC